MYWGLMTIRVGQKKLESSRKIRKILDNLQVPGKCISPMKTCEFSTPDIHLASQSRPELVAGALFEFRKLMEFENWWCLKIDEVPAGWLVGWLALAGSGWTANWQITKFLENSRVWTRGVIKASYYQVYKLVRNNYTFKRIWVFGLKLGV